jgi:D-threo-aldose 1-dehydrogenase
VNTNYFGPRASSVTILGFGGAPVGNLFKHTSDDDAAAAIDTAWNEGIRYFDTAPHYGLGLSERRLGRLVKSHNRDEMTISSKVGRLLTPNLTPSGSDLSAGGFAVVDDFVRTLDYSEDGIKKSIEGSLERLGTDYLDIVYVHDPDDHVDEVIDRTFPALVKLRDQGVVRAIGAGMNDWQPLLRFVNESDIDVVMLAGRWTLLDQSGEPLLRQCQNRGVAVVAAAPFNSGILSRPVPSSEGHFDYHRVPEDLLHRARELAAMCRQFGVELPEVAINFPLRAAPVVSVVAGFRTATQAQTGARWMETDIPSELWAEFETLEWFGGNF